MSILLKDKLDDFLKAKRWLESHCKGTIENDKSIIYMFSNFKYVLIENDSIFFSGEITDHNLSPAELVNLISSGKLN